MGERKVQCKYFPPDFDPTKLPKRNNFRDEQIKVRIMIPFTVQCSCCGEFIYRGTKFTSRKEDIDLETDSYLGLRKFRFYIKCPECLQEIVFKTDPKNSDYELEVGGTRNYEPWKQSDEMLQAKQDERDAEEKGDSMKALENRTIESKREMDILDALEEIRELNARKAMLNTEEMLDARHSHEASVIAGIRRQEEREDTKAVEIFAESKAKVVKRLNSDEEDDEPTHATSSAFSGLASSAFSDLPTAGLLVENEEGGIDTGSALPMGGLVRAVVKKRKKSDKKAKKKDKDKEKKKKKKKTKTED